MGKYVVSTEISFSASHSLRGYNGECSRIHGHNWILRVYYEFENLNDIGLTIDYGQLRESLKKVVCSRFDHQHINNISPFDKLNPTSENLAREIFKLCREEVQVEGGRLIEVELWETSRDMVRYREG